MLYSLDRPSARVIGRIDDYDDDYDDDETIELELNESAIRALTEAAVLAHAAFVERADPRLTPPDEPGPTALEHEAAAAGQVSEAVEHGAPAARQAAEALEQETPAGSLRAVSVARAPRTSRQFALGLGMVAAAAGLLGGVAYLATARAPHPIPIVADSGSRPTTASESPTSAPALTPLETPIETPPVTPDVPVRFKNPFDRSEVFEFPAGTSRTEMRDAVAELLSQRALERQSLFVKRPRRNTKTADGDASVTAGRATPRS
jgi:hypothetical protein